MWHLNKKLVKICVIKFIFTVGLAFKNLGRGGRRSKDIVVLKSFNPVKQDRLRLDWEVQYQSQQKQKLHALYM